MITQQEFDKIKAEEINKLCIECNAGIGDDSLWRWRVIRGELQVCKTEKYLQETKQC